MSKTGFAAGFAGAGILSVLWRFLGYVIRWLSTVMLYFGLYVPFFYLLYGLIIHLTLGVNLFNFATNSQLYLLGMLLCLISSVIIAVRNIILAPIKNVLKYYDRRGAPEQPLIYRSELNPDLIIYEYTGRYDVYRVINGRLNFIRTESKGIRY